jgi:hypothetical protein
VICSFGVAELVAQLRSSVLLLLQKKGTERKIKAAKYFGVHTFTLAHAIQLVVRRLADSSDSIAYYDPPQQVSKYSLYPKIF